MTLTTLSSREIIEKSNFADRLPDVKLPEAPPTQVRRIVFWMIFMGFGLFGGFGTWAALTPMTSAVIAPGAFNVIGDRLVVQHLDGGIVREINVQEGQLVQEGDIMVTLDAVRIQAQIAILRSQLATSIAQDERLRAEHANSETLEMSPALNTMLEEDPALEPVLAAQHDIFESNRNMLAGQVELLRNRIGQFEEQLISINNRRNAFQERYRLISEERADLESLYDQGLVPKSRLTQRREDEVSIITNIGLTDSEEINIQQRIAEIEERILQVRRDRMLVISDERQRLQSTIFDVQQRLDATVEVLDRVAIRAPKSGRIVNLNVNTLGGILDASEPVLEIVPTETEFVVEAQVSPSDIDEVVMGGTARIRLTAYSFRSTPPVSGEVVNISADSLTDQSNGLPYYRVDVALTPGSLSDLPHIKVLPGMPAQVMLETGAQTLGEYLLNPVIAGAETALSEGN